MKRTVLSLSLLLLINNGVQASAAPESALDGLKLAAAKASKPMIPPPPPDIQLVRPSKPKPKASTSVEQVDDRSLVIVGSAGPYTVKDPSKVQRFADYLEVKPGQEKANLSMTLTNRGFRWFRMFVSNQLVATEKELGGRSEGKIDLTGIAQSGSNQIVIQGAGPSGAQISWKVSTKAAPKLDSVTPEEAIVEDVVILAGSGFSKNMTDDKVMFNSKTGQITQATESEIKVRIPRDAELGENKVTVKVNGVDSNTIKMKIRGIPELSGSNLQGVPPGQTLVLYGKNFSPVTGENKVSFGGTSGEVVASTPTTLTVIVPTPPYHAGHGPCQVRVTVGKIESKNSIPVTIGPQMFADPGFAGSPDTPFLPSGF